MSGIHLPDPPDLASALVRLQASGTPEERLEGIVEAHATLTGYLAEISRTYAGFTQRIEDCRARKEAAEAEIAALGSTIQQIASLIVECYPPGKAAETAVGAVSHEVGAITLGAAAATPAF